VWKATCLRTTRLVLALLAGLELAAGAATARAEEGTVTHLDPSCGFFVVKFAGDAGYGLFESRSGPPPAVGHVLEGDLVEGKEIEVVNKTAGATNRLIHWANAATPVALIRNYPFQCTSRWQRRD
jgi:hypothetical protein